MIEIFYCYAREDEKFRADLDAHLWSLRRSQLALSWYDGKISPGTDWSEELSRHLNSADVILLLVSRNFMNSEFCYSIEMKRALERHDKGEARVIPILLKPFDWQSAPFAKLALLPAGGKPITKSKDREQAYTDIALAIRKVVDELSAKPAKTKILAIEDDPDVLAGYVAYFEEVSGYQVLEAVTGSEGKRLLAEHPDTSLIILDLGLPDTSGEAWLEWYMAQGKRIPVIVASGGGTILKVTKGNALTAAITKPFDMSDLQELIDALLAQV